MLVDCKWVGRERKAYVWAKQLGRGLVCSEMGGLREGEQVGGAWGTVDISCFAGMLYQASVLSTGS